MSAQLTGQGASYDNISTYPSIQIRPIHCVETGNQVSEHDYLRRHNVIACAGDRGYRQKLSGLARGGADGCHTTLESRHALLKYILQRGVRHNGEYHKARTTVGLLIRE